MRFFNPPVPWWRPITASTRRRRDKRLPPRHWNWCGRDAGAAVAGERAGGDACFEDKVGRDRSRHIDTEAILADADAPPGGGGFLAEPARVDKAVIDGQVGPAGRRPARLARLLTQGRRLRWVEALRSAGIEARHLERRR